MSTTIVELKNKQKQASRSLNSEAQGWRIKGISNRSLGIKNAEMVTKEIEISPRQIHKEYQD